MIQSRTPLRDALNVSRLAIADLVDDRFQTLCLVVAISAIATPLIVMLGLRVGVIADLRATMIEDPFFREIVPDDTRDYTPEFFDEMIARDDVAFVIPGILLGSSVIGARSTTADQVLTPDMIPSGPGDVVLAMYGVPDLGETDVAISHRVAEALGVTRGDTLVLLARATVTGRRLSEPTSFTIRGVLPPRAGGEVVYAPLSFVLDVENFRLGRGVPERGWAGRAAVPEPAYDGAFVVTRDPLSDLGRARAMLNTSFLGERPFAAETLRATTGLSMPDLYAGLDLRAVSGTAVRQGVAALEDRTRAYAAAVLPYAALPELTFVQDDRRWQAAPAGASLKDWQEELFATALPWPSSIEPDRVDLLSRMIAPTLWGVQVGSTVSVGFTHGATNITFPVTVVGVADLERPVFPRTLVGILRTAMDEAVTLDAEGRFVLAPGGFRSFRLYARSIDDVEALAVHLQDQGIPVRSRRDRIASVRLIDAALGALFAIVALVAVGGGMAAFAANTLASIKRKTLDLGTLRLLGFRRNALVVFPLIQTLTMAAVATGLAFAAFYAVRAVINTSLAPQLGFGSDLCVLRPQDALAVTAVILGAAAFCGMIGAVRVLRIEPREALRAD